VASGEKFDSPTYTDVPVVDATATYDAEAGRAALFVANRSLTEPATLEVDARGLGVTGVLTASSLCAAESQDRHTTNRDGHDAVRPVPFTNHALTDGTLRATLPALSWTVFELEATRG